MTYESSFCVFPQDTNYMGLQMVFGGKMMSEMDIAAALAIRRLLTIAELPGYSVTVGVNNLTFLLPAYLGDIVRIQAHVTKFTKKTITCRVLAYVQSKGQTDEQQMAFGDFTFCYMVDGTPTPHGIEET